MAESFLTLMAEYCEADQQRISVWYDALQDAGFTGTQTPGLPHHISLATFAFEQEAEAIAAAKQAAARFAPVEVDVTHVGLFGGGKVLFAAPDVNERLYALKHAFGSGRVGAYPWTPHTTMLMDEPEQIARALPVLMRHFTPIRGRITRLHLCAFWPTREILTVELTGNE